jgi:hypothetical protein
MAAEGTTMLKKIALGLGAVLAVLLVVIALQPSAFVIERSATMNAPADIVYAQINDLRAWEAWSPWAKMDPQMKSTFEGPASGVGAVTSWSGPDAGKGRMEITAVKPNQEVDIKLDFLEPMQATNRTLFTLTENAGATTVNWRMQGNNGFAGKGFALFMNMDKLVGADFEKGLASMKALTEAAATKRKAEGAAAQAAASPTPAPANAVPEQK